MRRSYSWRRAGRPSPWDAATAPDPDLFSPPPPLPVPSLGAAAPRPPLRPERPRPQTPDGLKDARQRF
ncbi:hypothetical protein FNV62_15105 [Streptomyces sp. RLB3-17]|nr:hypothetical protein FNV67_16970 [Streptomyces sp. S1D4-20]QDN66956.1 hypothetical protein FNV66_16565 [Streptomyces sp. S1D4-14]QDN77203.1 hypothetical protein FNV64_17875 [Streptomyces sp. S1A1-7]QDN97568.1 hypothetical protein FNV58_17560 [Streptomyces sp. RLB1-9]QDO19274.1 hypothetical protein FNV65_16010 [Streptomyces sp. S1A1-8]QDO29401.1 hypothetical protein FNV63_16025 [Streptomyces sp. S1A1-3]QDO39304.1 hypothetical protein FNV62_15105 [Streptomyces sp. RLB3-17]QDO49362.1 hypothe